MDQVYLYALKLLRMRDYSVSRLREKLAAKFGSVPDAIIDELIRKKFLNDRRFAENYIARKADRGQARLREELLTRGIPPGLADEILTQTAFPSLRGALEAKMNDWKLRLPLQPRDAARLFRALARLGYDEDALREELENLHEQ